MAVPLLGDSTLAYTNSTSAARTGLSHSQVRLLGTFTHTSRWRQGDITYSIAIDTIGPSTATVALAEVTGEAGSGQ
jgi:hypothetical protein